MGSFFETNAYKHMANHTDINYRIEGRSNLPYLLRIVRQENGTSSLLFLAVYWPNPPKLTQPASSSVQPSGYTSPSHTTRPAGRTLAVHWPACCHIYSKGNGSK